MILGHLSFNGAGGRGTSGSHRDKKRYHGKYKSTFPPFTLKVLFLSVLNQFPFHFYIGKNCCITLLP